MSKIIIKNARIIDPGREIDQIGDIFINDGLILAIGKNILLDSDYVIDATGLVAAPGLVDMHVHMRDPGFTYKDDIITVGECAAAGGVTTVAAMPNTNPVADNVDTIRYILDKSYKSKVKVLPVGAITKGLRGIEVTNFKLLKDSGAVAFSDDGMPVSTAKLMSDALKQSILNDVNILAHCEEKSLSEGGIINEGAVSEILGVAGIPSSSENVGISREIALAKTLNACVHICHVSTADAVELIKLAKHIGIKVTAETCPQYFSFNDEMLLHRDADYKMNPPLRSELDRKAIIRAIINGTIDVIATDHAPHSREEKKCFLEAPNGVIGLETSLAAGITNLVNSGCISMSKLIYMMSTMPAQILGIVAGSLNIGKSADIVIFNAEERWIVNPDLLHGKSKNSPFKGMEFCGKVKYTICRGEIIYKDKK